MSYYMITFYIDEKTQKKDYRPFINPYESIKKAQSAVNWQKVGGFENQIIATRINESEFKNIHTKEVIKVDLNNRNPYTLEAWNEFKNRKY